jgi:hypothetical protein
MDVFTKKSWIFFVLLILFQLPLLSPLLREGYFHSHDDFSVQRVIEYKASLQNGEIPARWSDNLLYGYGYPLFIFYSPLVYAVGATVSMTGVSALLSVKLLTVIFVIGGPLGIYLWLKQITKNSLGAFIGALVYSYAPYRATDLYIRGALAEFAALSLLPWILLFLWKMARERSLPAAVFAGVSMGALVTTHHITSLLFGMFYLPYLVFVFRSTRSSFKHFLFHSGVSVVVALGISCWYWAPLIIESPYINTASLYAFPLNFFLLTIQGLWHSPWGYGGVLEQDPMSLQLGKTLFLIIGAVTLLIPLWIRRKSYSLLYWILVFHLFAFLELQQSVVIWDSIPLLHVLRIPWRIHLLLITIGSYIAARAAIELLSLVPTVKQREMLGMAYMACLTVMMVTQLPFFYPKMFYRTAYSHETTTWDDEYLPVWVKQKPAGPLSEVRVLSGDATVINHSLGYLNKIVAVEARSETTVEFPTLWYPGWSARLDHRSVAIGVKRDDGTVTVSVPPGTHTVQLRFIKPWWRLLADGVSVVMLLGVIAFLGTTFLTRYKKPRRHHHHALGKAFDGQ